MLQPNDIVRALNNTPLQGNTVAPPLIIGQEYKVEEVYTCPCGQEHIHVGLVSEYAYVTCYTCKKELPDGNKKHWCHPTRLEKIS